MTPRMAERIIISRTDSIGDVVLTLPLAGAIKKYLPGSEVIFLGRDYTRDVITLSKHVDEFISWDTPRHWDNQEKIHWLREKHADVIIHVFPDIEIARLAKRAGIRHRIGTTGRLYHYYLCNKLVPLSRRKSNLHEAQLNFPLLHPIIPSVKIPAIEEIPSLYGFSLPEGKTDDADPYIDTKRFNLILHPKSKGSAREWPLDHYTALIRMLPEEKFNILVTGTAAEAEMMTSFLSENSSRITDLTGRFTLQQFIRFIGTADGLVAASTGPLHLAAALGKKAIGIYPPIRPMHPGRWAPLGENASYLVVDRACNDCRKSGNCHCMSEITPEQIMNSLTDDKRT